MDIRELFLRYFPSIKKNWLPLALGSLGMIFFAYGLIGLFVTGKAGSEDIIFQSSGKNSIEVKTIFVDVEGAVVNPGVYKLPQESRIQDGLVAAGGLSAKADREYIAKNLNLAIKLTDGAKVFIPIVGEAVGGGSALNASSEGITIGALININTASESQLDTLPGIGPVTAQKIIAGRPYSSTDELLSRKVVGTKVFDQIKGKISVY